MSELSLTLIDVGSGDSLFIEAANNQGARSFALIDSNDEPNWRASEMFITKYLRTSGISFGSPNRLFAFVMVTHAHADHLSGLKRLLQVFGAEWFYYPECTPSADFALL